MRWPEQFRNAIVDDLHYRIAGISDVVFLKDRNCVADLSDEVNGIVIYMETYKELPLTYQFIKYLHELTGFEDFNIETERDSDYGEFSAFHTNKYRFWKD